MGTFWRTRKRKREKERVNKKKIEKSLALIFTCKCAWWCRNEIPEYLYPSINYGFPVDAGNTIVPFKNATGYIGNNSSSFSATRSFSFVGMMFYEIRSSYISLYRCTYLSLQTSLTLIRTAYFPKLERVGVGSFQNDRTARGILRMYVDIFSYYKIVVIPMCEIRLCSKCYFLL